MKKLLDKIDQYIWKRGGILYRIWFVFEGSGKRDDDTGAELGIIRRRLTK